MSANPRLPMRPATHARFRRSAIESTSIWPRYGTLHGRCAGLAGQLLTRFRDRLPGVSPKSSVAWAGKLERRIGTTHSLKGEAGSLAAQELHRAAAALEKHLSPTPRPMIARRNDSGRRARVVANETLGACRSASRCFNDVHPFSPLKAIRCVF